MGVRRLRLAHIQLARYHVRDEARSVFPDQVYLTPGTLDGCVNGSNFLGNVTTYFGLLFKWWKRDQSTFLMSCFEIPNLVTPVAAMWNCRDVETSEITRNRYTPVI